MFVFCSIIFSLLTSSLKRFFLLRVIIVFRVLKSPRLVPRFAFSTNITFLKFEVESSTAFRAFEIASATAHDFFSHFQWSSLGGCLRSAFPKKNKRKSVQRLEWLKYRKPLGNSKQYCPLFSKPPFLDVSLKLALDFVQLVLWKQTKYTKAAIVSPFRRGKYTSVQTSRQKSVLGVIVRHQSKGRHPKQNASPHG